MRNNHYLKLFLKLILLLTFLLSACSPTEDSLDKTTTIDDTAENSTESDDTKKSNSALLTEFTFDNQTLFDAGYEEQLLSKPTTDSDLDLSTIELTDELLEELNAEIEVPAPRTNFEFIQQDFDNNKINREEYAYYTVLSSYADDKLPSNYQGTQSYGTNIQFEIQYLVDHWDSLPDAIRTEIEPYLVRISDERSIFNQPIEQTSSRLLPASFVVSAASDLVIRTSYSHSNVTYEIEFPSPTNQSQAVDDHYKERVKFVKKAITECYADYVSLLNDKLSKKVIVEIVPMGTDYGEAWEEDNEYRIRINIYKLLNEKITKSTFVHELFHCMQFEMGMEYEKTEIKWAMEATATWAEHYIYKSANSEHEYLSTFFSTLHKDRIGFGDNFEYGSYMLMYFLTDYWDSNAFVGKYLNAIKGNSSSLARSYFSSNISDFREAYGEFAKYNFDKQPLEYYFDAKKLSGNATGRAVKYYNITGDDKETKTVKLDAGSIKYYYFSFADVKNAEHIKFEFEDDLSLSEGMRQAAIYANGEWRTEDWSEILEVKYCRNSLDELEHVDKVILYYSNADLEITEEEIMDKFTVTTEPCKDEVKVVIQGTYTITGATNQWSSKAIINETCKVVDHNLFFVYKTSYDIEGEYIDEGITYLTTSGSVSESFSEEPTIEDNYIRAIYPLGIGTEKDYAEMEKFGITEIIPENGLLFTLPYFDKDPTGVTHMSFPQPVGTVTMDLPLMMDGLSQIGAIKLPLDIRSEDDYTFTMTINPQNYDSPIDELWVMDFSKFEEAMGAYDLGFDMPEMPDLGDIVIPDGMDFPGMETPNGGLGDGFDAINNIMSLNTGNYSGYETILELQVDVIWLSSD